MAGDGSEENVRLSFSEMKDFEPEQVPVRVTSTAYSTNKFCWC
ncbi:TPA: hypothetical protein ACQ301_004440 [Yersinia enterocolitica]